MVKHGEIQTVKQRLGGAHWAIGQHNTVVLCSLSRNLSDIPLQCRPDYGEHPNPPLTNMHRKLDLSDLRGLSFILSFLLY